MKTSDGTWCDRMAAAGDGMKLSLGGGQAVAHIEAETQWRTHEAHIPMYPNKKIGFKESIFNFPYYLNVFSKDCFMTLKHIYDHT